MSESRAPSGFEEEAFLRNVKVQFIRLQAAYDQKNLGDLREFTAPDVFAEIKMQLNERGEQHNITDVIELNAELLDASQHNEAWEASVKFTGMIKEDDLAPAAFIEIWHFKQDPYSKNWLVMGIQQN